jgi:hypothetical protein
MERFELINDYRSLPVFQEESRYMSDKNGLGNM